MNLQKKGPFSQSETSSIPIKNQRRLYLTESFSQLPDLMHVMVRIMLCFLFITTVFTTCLLCSARRFNLSSMGDYSGMKVLRLDQEKCCLRSLAGCFQNNPTTKLF